jgi:60 kDa SS-A/Ro ribonucleoprotein
VPFDTQAFEAAFDPSDSILSLAERLAKFGGGGTDCSLPIAKANTVYATRKFVGIVLVSDNESWVRRGLPYVHGAHGSTGVMTEWQLFVRKQVLLQGGDFVGPKLICIDLQPNTTTQAPERSDILNVGGFSDAVFQVMAAFLGGDENRFVAEVESVAIEQPRTE